MATLTDLEDQVREIMFGVARVERPAEDTLAAVMSDSTTSSTPATPAMWKRGNYAEFDNGEVIIFGADSAGATAVRRAQRGTTATSHAVGDVMSKNPWPLRVTVSRQIRDVVRTDLWPHVWTWHNGEITFQAGHHLYPLPPYVVDVAAVEQSNVDADGKFRPIGPDRWDVERVVDSAIATNGSLLRLRDPFDVDSTIYYRGIRRPDPDDLANLDVRLEPMVAWAAAAKCFVTGAGAATQDRARTQRRDGGQVSSMYQMLMGEFLRLRGEYKRQLLDEVRRDRRFRPRMRRSW